MISNGMIIQRDAPFPIWSEKKITITFMDKTYESSGSDGKWLIMLDPVQAGGPYSMEISDDKDTYMVKDIYAGDLWLCAGQSNMEMQMARLCDNFPEEWKCPDYPIIRQFKAPQEWDFSAPRGTISGSAGDAPWISASTETMSEFTATGWFFAKNLYKKYIDAEGQTVPIGLISTAWGGTPVESWMSRDALESYPKIIADGDQYADSAKNEEISQRTAYSILEWETNLKHEDVGFPLSWQNPETDISDWDEMNLPGSFSNEKTRDELINFCGVIWLAKDFEVSADFAKSDAKVWLGTIIDSDTVYVNGTEIGNTGYRYPPRKYPAKGVLKPGKNRIVMRVTCNSGQGGVTCDNPFRVFTDNETVELTGVWKYKIGAAAPARPQEFFFQWQPMGCYNAMIAPLLKFPLKGVIWYQGESNESRPHEYADLFQKMILDWRTKNGNDKLPFFFVQLPIFHEPSDNNERHSWALIREAQVCALSLPFTGMAAAWECGEWNDIHPINKKDVGYRLYLAAEKLLFGVENTSPGPMVKKHEIKEEKLYIYFDNYGKELKRAISNEQYTSGEKEGRGESPSVFVSVITDEKQINVPAVIEGRDCLVVDLASVKKPKKVLYAWANNPKDRQLYNSEGLPCLPFKIIL